MSVASDLPVVVIGAGPQGLAAAAHLVERSVPVIVLEQGATPAAAVAEWAHVRLFSEWPELIDSAAARLLAPTGWQPRTQGYPTGAEWIAHYLTPLADALVAAEGGSIRVNSRVVGVSRLGRDRLVSDGRSEQPFTVHVETADGQEYRLEASAVIDASGNWATPNPAGADGVPALGEKASAACIDYVIPDYTHENDAGKHHVVIGAGHSALTAVVALGRIARRDPSTTVTWALRRGSAGDAFGGGNDDELPARGQLGITAKTLVEGGAVQVVTGFRTSEFSREGDRLVVASEDGRSLEPADRVAVLTGFRPDLSFISELRIKLDPILQAPPRVAREVDPNLHSCGTVAATGARDLAHPEKDFYIVGAKSYGRAPTFLALTGYEQVRSVVAAIAGDHEAAKRVELTLPETGVCGGAGDFGGAGSACCAAPVLNPRVDADAAPAPSLIQLSAPPR